METYLYLIKAQPAFHLCVNTGVSKHDGLLLETGKQITETGNSLRAFPAFLSPPVPISFSGACLHPKPPTAGLSGTAGWTKTLFLTARK